MQFNDDKIWESFKTRGFYFCYLKVNSLLSKTGEPRDTKIHMKLAILSITESKQDSFATNAGVNINVYIIIRNDRKRNGGGVAFCVRNYLFFNTKNFFSNSIEHVFFEILIPKVKPITIGIFYRSLHSNDFLNKFLNIFQKIDNKTNEISLLGDFNIDLLQNGKFILKENQSNELKNPISTLVNKFKEFCQTF